MSLLHMQNEWAITIKMCLFVSILMMPPLRRQRSAGPPSTHGTASPCDPQARDTSPTRISVRLAVKKKKHGSVLSQSSTAPDLPSSTTIRSARAIVDSRCATITHVVCRCANILSIASLTRCSLVASSALVASSSARIAGRFSSARAIARRWRWPPLRLCRPTVVRQERVLCK